MVVLMDSPRPDLARLASYVVAARIKAGYPTRKDFAKATGITARTLGKLENATEPVSDSTLARVSEVLGWAPDFPALVMAPGPLEPPPPVAAPGAVVTRIGAAPPALDLGGDEETIARTIFDLPAPGGGTVPWKVRREMLRSLLDVNDRRAAAG